VGSLLEAIGIKINKRAPSRTRERFEQALDKLQDDQLIAAWEYLDWDETIAESYGWARLWANTRIVITHQKQLRNSIKLLTKREKINHLHIIKIREKIR